MWFCIPRFSGIPFGGNLLLSCMGIILSLGCTRPEPGELPPPTPRETVSEMPFVLSKVQIGPFETVLEAGSSLQIPVNLFDEAGSPFPDRALSWASQDTRIASIDKNGVLTAHAPGFSTVTVNVKGLSDSIKIQVVPPPIAHIEIRPSVTRLPIGERQAYFIFAT
ncbi:MAG TPA: Ig-like domain-containing protein, partial [Nitrospiria bacterium]|nr:Ig-like domain-containing protein [Nitrospiria bacterium]